MWLSTKTRYGLKAIYEIGINFNKNPVPLSIIAEKHEISLSYLEQIIALLKKAGIIKSTRGPQGGYSLKKPPETISIGEIIRALEGSYAPTECVERNEKCFYASECITHSVFTKINDSISQVVDNMTLKDWIDEKRGDD